MKPLELKGIRMLGFSDLGGAGCGMQMMQRDDFVFVGRSRPGLPVVVVDVSRPAHPRVVAELPCYPGTAHTKCQLYDDYLLVNYELRGERQPGARTGWAVYDVSDPTRPQEIAYVDTGGLGVHRMWWAGEPYVYLSARPEGFRERMLEIYDFRDVGRPQLVGRWWTPGLWAGGGEEPPPPARNGPNTLVHHGIQHDGRLYCGYWDAGILILDVNDPARPRVISQLEWEAGQGAKTHTALPLPGRKLLAVTDESAHAGQPQNPKYFRLVDISDEEHPRELSRWRPDPERFDQAPGRVGAHNLHENRPGAFRGEDLAFVTFCNAGLRVLDISDPQRPREQAYFIPEAPPGQPACEANDIFVAADGRIFLSDRFGGMHILAMD